MSSFDLPAVGGYIENTINGIMLTRDADSGIEVLVDSSSSLDDYCLLYGLDPVPWPRRPYYVLLSTPFLVIA